MIPSTGFLAGNLKDFCCNQLGQELKVAEKKYEELQAEAEKVQPTVGMRKKSRKPQLSQFFGAESEGHNYFPIIILSIMARPKNPA